MDNVSEYLTATNPTNRSSRLEFSGIGMLPQENLVRAWQSVLGKLYTPSSFRIKLQ